MFWDYYVSCIIIGRLVADHASATHGWWRWALTMVRGDQRKQSNFTTSNSTIIEVFKNAENSFKSAASANAATASYVNGIGKWTLIDAGKTPLTNGMQFVGSCSISVYTSSDTKRLIFVVANSTSKWSYKAHGLLSGSENIPRANPYSGYIPGKGMYQVPQSTILNLYIWTESMNANRLYYGY